MEVVKNSEKFNPEEEFKYITNYFGLKLSNEEEEFVVNVLKNDDYAEFFENNNPSFILIKFLQENKKTENLWEDTSLELSFELFSFNLKNEINLESCENLDSIIEQFTYWLQSEWLKEFSKEKKELFFDICKNNWLLGSEWRPNIELIVSEFQEIIIDLEEKIKLFNKWIEKNLFYWNMLVNTTFIYPISLILIWIILENVSNNPMPYYISGLVAIWSFLTQIKEIQNTNFPKIGNLQDFDSFIHLIKQSLKGWEWIPVIKEEAVARVKWLLEKIRV